MYDDSANVMIIDGHTIAQVNKPQNLLKLLFGLRRIFAFLLLFDGLQTLFDEY